jgi:hypothetical protein
MLRTLTLALGIGCLCSWGAGAAVTLVPVAPYPGSTTTFATSINDDNSISGDYTTADGIEHAFFGPLGGPYTSFDYGSTSVGTEARSIDNKGVIVGYAPDGNAVSGPAFYRKADGTFLALKKDGVQLQGIAQGLNKLGFSVGDYVTDPDTLAQTGYQAHAGRFQKDLAPGLDATRVAPRAITTDNIVAGWYDDASRLQHGFILSDGGTRTIDVDTSGTTNLEGLNDNGIATGTVLDGEQDFHAFVLDTDTDNVTWIAVPGATYAQIWGINRKGLAAISTDIGSYIYCPFKPAKCPAGGTEIATRTTRLLRPGTHMLPRIPAREARRGLSP